MHFIFLLILLQEILLDGGATYAETNFDYWIVEPWNAISSLSFLIPVFYWLRKLKGKYTEYPFLSYCMPLLFLGGVGSTLFHAFRASPFFLLLDVLPILMLTASLSIFFWVKILPKWWYIFFLIAPYFLIQHFILNYIPLPYSINLAYLLRGFTMFLPAFLWIQSLNFKFVEFLGLAILYFVLALCFRYFDNFFAQWMYMGSHWLWHISTSIGSFYLAEFLYRIEKMQKVHRIYK